MAAKSETNWKSSVTLAAAGTSFGSIHLGVKRIEKGVLGVTRTQSDESIRFAVIVVMVTIFRVATRFARKQLHHRRQITSNWKCAPASHAVRLRLLADIPRRHRASSRCTKNGIATPEKAVGPPAHRILRRLVRRERRALPAPMSLPAEHRADR